jgi:hypothetical protein
VSAVQHSTGEDVKPELGQRRENDGEIPSVVRGKKSGNVLNEDIPAGLYKLICDPRELEEQVGASALVHEPGSSAGDREVLAGEAATENVNGMVFCRSAPARIGGERLRSSDQSLPVNVAPHVSDIGVAGHSGESVREDSSSPPVGFALEHDRVSGPFESEVDAADP